MKINESWSNDSFYTGKKIKSQNERKSSKILSRKYQDQKYMQGKLLLKSTLINIFLKFIHKDMINEIINSTNAYMQRIKAKYFQNI